MSNLVQKPAPPIINAGDPMPPHAGKRDDIQGLRAIAVALVVLDHLFGWPAGGFVGVDVFFVISGFLITGLLLKEGERTGRVSITNFYRRRIRRIMPAAVVALAATVAVSSIVFQQSRAESVAVDGLWALIFLVNWHLAAVGTDYFQAALPESPLQHFWSLSVEEQFYIVWPVLLIALLVVKRRVPKLSARLAVGVFSILVIALSFVWAMQQSAGNPTVAYFSTFTRAWELALGALAAAALPLFRKIPRVARNVLAAAGLVGLAAGAFLITDQSQFPAPWAALPVVATCLLIVAGSETAQTPVVSRLITSAPFVFVGAISYSLYLWHWPVIVIADDAIGSRWLFFVVTIPLIAVLSVASYIYVEQKVLDSEFMAPVRGARWYFRSPRSGRRYTLRRQLRNWRDRRGRGFDKDTQVVLFAGFAVLSLAAIVTLFQLAKVGPIEANEDTLVTLDEPAPGATPGAGPSAIVTELQEQLREALGASEYPPLTPTLADPSAGMAAEMYGDADCLNPSDPTDASLCTYGPADAERSMFVVGDSIAISWMPALRAALPGWSIHGVGFSECPYGSVDVDLEHAERQGPCDEGREAVLAQIRAEEPDLVVGSQVQWILGQLEAEGDAAAGSLEDGVAAFGREVAESGGRIIALGANPPGPAPEECSDRPDDCVTSVDEQGEIVQAAESAGARAAGGVFIDTTDWFCADDSCPVFAAGRLMRWDAAHITEPYARFIAPALREALRPVLARLGRP